MKPCGLSWLAWIVVVLTILTSCTSGNTERLPEATESTTSTDEALNPGIALRDFQINMQLEGTTQESSRVELVPHPQLVLRSQVETGARVRRGQHVGQSAIRPDILAAIGSPQPHSPNAGVLAMLTSLVGPVEAPADGLIEAEDESRVAVRAPGVDVVVPLTPIQELRYRSARFTGEARIETIAGQQRVGCQALWLERTVADDGPHDPGSAGASLHCRLPQRVETVGGLRAPIRLSSERFDNAIVVPALHVGFDEAADVYFIEILEEGQKRRIPVTVGASDGVLRVIVSDVPVGAVLSSIEDPLP